MTPEELATKMAEVPKMISDLKSEVRDLTAKRNEEVAAHGAASAELRQQLAKAQSDLNEAKLEQQRFAQEVKSEREEQTKRLDAIETKAARTSHEAGPEGDTPGRLFTKSAAWKAFAEKRTARFSEPVEYKTGELLSSVATRVVVPQRAPMVAAPERRLRLRDLIPVTQTGSNAIEYLEETGFYKVGGTLAVTSVTSVTTAATLTAAAAHGIPVGHTRRIRVSGAVETEYNGDFTATATSPTVLTYTMTADPSGSSATGTVLYQQIQTHGAADWQTEGSAKNQAALELALRTANVGTIAHWLRISRQLAEDAPGMASFVDNRLLYGLDLKEDSEIIYGSGSAPAMNGILANANVPTYLWSTGTVGDKKQDAIRRAMSLVFRAEYEPTGIVLNDADMVDIELAKDDQNGYMLGVMMAVQGLGERLWRVPVVVTNAIAPGTALVGAFRMATELWERQAGQIRIGDQDATNFTTNLLTVLAEKRMAQTIYRPEAFVEVSFDSAPSA